MSEKQFEILAWDSSFFGFSTARIMPSRLGASELGSLLHELRQNNVKLAYWAASSPVTFDLNPLGGALVDQKVTFQADLTRLEPQSSLPIDDVQPPSQADLLSEPFRKALLSLAVQAGEFSRFAVDTHFPRDLFTSLYHEWMRNSLTHDLADDVLAIQIAQLPVGMVTVRQKGTAGEIGLIAVHPDWRGKHYGEKLVRAAQLWASRGGLTIARVVTQARNLPACRLYEKCGYHLASTEYFHHFWL